MGTVAMIISKQSINNMTIVTADDTDKQVSSFFENKFTTKIDKSKTSKK